MDFENMQNFFNGNSNNKTPFNTDQGKVWRQSAHQGDYKQHGPGQHTRPGG